MEEAAPVRHRRRLSALALLILAGCNQVFGLAETEPLVDAPVIDDDEDGVADDNDNCVGRKNPTQSDQDRDTLGDECDNCPLTPNPMQESRGDSDLVGDACDPHPVAVGDCLVLVESFDDADRFEERWQVLADPGARVDVHDGSIELIAGPSTSIGIVATGLTGMFSVHLLGSSPLPLDASVYVFTNATSLFTSYGCGVHQRPELSVAELHDGHQALGPFGAGMTPHIGSSLHIRFGASLIPDSRARLSCRVDHGIGFGYGRLEVTAPVMLGGPGARATGAPATIEALAFYRFAPGMACADADFR